MKKFPYATPRAVTAASTGSFYFDSFGDILSFLVDLFFHIKNRDGLYFHLNDVFIENH